MSEHHEVVGVGDVTVTDVFGLNDEDELTMVRHGAEKVPVGNYQLKCTCGETFEAEDEAEDHLRALRNRDDVDVVGVDA